jgi:glyoxylase-like metal-dependent hydrolase (beta-lactamase superfamily II)
MNVALFPNAEVVDFWARYKDDLWLDMPGDGYRLSPKAQLWLTPGHTQEDASLIVEADDGVYAMTHLWWHADRSPEIDPFADDQPAIDAGRERVLAVADVVVPGHGAPFRVEALGPGHPSEPNCRGRRRKRTSATSDHRRSSMRLLAGAVLSAFLLAACGSASPPPSAPTALSPAPSAPAAAIDVDALVAGAPASTVAPCV